MTYQPKVTSQPKVAAVPPISVAAATWPSSHCRGGLAALPHDTRGTATAAGALPHGSGWPSDSGGQW